MAKSNLPDSVSVHGVFLSVFNKGVLLQGPAGIGKSECALALLDRGHQLIADDSTVFTLKQQQLFGSCPHKGLSCLEVRGLGIIDVTQIFGDQAVLATHPLALIIQLQSQLDNQEKEEIKEKEEKFTERILIPRLESTALIGILIPTLKLWPQFSKNMAVLIETAVRLAFAPPSVHIERLLA